MFISCYAVNQSTAEETRSVSGDFEDHIDLPSNDVRDSWGKC